VTELKRRDLPYLVLSGDYEERERTAFAATLALLANELPMP